MRAILPLALVAPLPIARNPASGVHHWVKRDTRPGTAGSQIQNDGRDCVPTRAKALTVAL